MNSARQDWQVPFDCPACGRRVVVHVGAMHSVLRCPNCHRRSVIDLDALRTTSLRQIIQRATNKHSRARDAAAIRTRPFIPGWVRRARPWMAVVAVGLLVLALSGLAYGLWPSIRMSSSLDATEVHLATQARSFTTALLADDQSAAARMVHPDDQLLLTRWWRLRRAAIKAGRARSVDGRVTEVRVERRMADQATLRVAFTIDGREQLEFVEFQAANGDWRIRLPKETGSND